jgi:hypothetical protein
VRKIACSLCALLLTLVAAPAYAQTGTLGEAISDLARDVKAVVGGQRLSVGQFPGTGDIGSRSSAGPLLQTALEKKLKELGTTIVDKKADYELRGEYTEMEDSNTGRQFVQIKLELRDREGNSRFFVGIENNKATKYYVKNEADLAKMLGENVYVPPDAPADTRIKAHKEAIDHPKSVIQGTRVLPAANAPFAIEVFTAPHRANVATPLGDYKVRTPHDEKGLPFVPIARDNVYAVKLINYADYAVAVDLRIDGLSMFHSSEIRDKAGNPAYRYIILPKRGEYLVRGWFINLKHTDEFLVTEYAKSEAGRIGIRDAKLGTITASFHAAWDPKVGPPHDEPKNSDKYSLSADATGKGSRISVDYQVVEYEIGVFRAAVSVRYTK